MRYLIGILFLCLTLNVSAQKERGNSRKEKPVRIKGAKKLKILLDRQESDGARLVETDNACFAHGGGLLTEKYEAFRLCYAQKGDIKIYELLFPMTRDYRLRFESGSKMLVKLDDGEVLELSITHEIDDLDNKSHVSSYGVYYTFNPSYIVTNEQLQKMIEKKVVKLRFAINMGDGYFDMDSADYSKWIFSEILSQCYDMIVDRLDVKNGFYDNF